MRVELPLTLKFCFSERSKELCKYGDSFNTNRDMCKRVECHPKSSNMLLNINFSGHLPVQLVLNEILRHPLGTFRKTLSRVFCIIPDRIVLTCDSATSNYRRQRTLFIQNKGPSQELSFHKNFRPAIGNFVSSGMHSNFRTLHKIRSNFRLQKKRNFARNISKFSVEQ